MKKINKHIEIVRTNRSGLSSMGQASCNNLLEVLSKNFQRVGVTVLSDISDLNLLVKKRPDLVFLGMKFLPIDFEASENEQGKVWITDFLDLHEIEYTGSTQSAHILELNKSYAKSAVKFAGLKTGSHFVVLKHQKINGIPRGFQYPLFVKPADRGGGLGIDDNSVVRTDEQLIAKVRSISEDFNSDSLVEQYLSGREFSVGILKDQKTQELTAMPLELIAPINQNGERILTGAVKEADTENFIEVEDALLKSRINRLALASFSALGARDYGRIDIRLDKDGAAYFLEANLIPSILKDYGNFPKACMLNLGLNYEQMILRIVDLALFRNKLFEYSEAGQEAIASPALTAASLI